jgi:hypothetical protein
MSTTKINEIEGAIERLTPPESEERLASIEQRFPQSIAARCNQILQRDAAMPQFELIKVNPSSFAPIQKNW